MNKNIYTVGYINSYIKRMFQQDILLHSVSIRGEISNVKYHSSNHIYFSIKDSTGVLACVMFAGDRARGLKFPLSQGQQVICTGTVDSFPRDGKYQLYAKEILLDGVGQLYEKYEKLKKEFEEMGMFAPEYKKPIPKYAERVGVVTASTGAAIQDIINVTKRRNPYVQLILYPAKVQGDGAAETIVNGIRALDTMNVDVIIVGRGGGSIEDLWAFNEEIVARAIFECETPIVSAVGHEVDWTIADYVSDRRAPTPSAAAEITVFEYSEFSEKLFDLYSNLNKNFRNVLSDNREIIEKYRLMLMSKSPENMLNEKKMMHIRNEEKLKELMMSILNRKKHEYELYIQQLKALSPLEKLSKGFAYVEDSDGHAVKSAKDVSSGKELMLNLSDGVVKTKVTEVIING